MDPFDSSSRDEIALEWLHGRAAEQKQREDRLHQAIMVVVLASLVLPGCLIVHETTRVSADPATRLAPSYFYAVSPWLGSVSMLAIRPVDSFMIRHATVVVTLFYAVIVVAATSFTLAAIRSGNRIDMGGHVLKAATAVALVLLQTEACGKREPRQQLQQLWFGIRLNLTVHGAIAIFDFLCDSPPDPVELVMGLSHVILASVARTRFRGTATRALDTMLAQEVSIAHREQGAAFLSSLTNAQLDVFTAYTSAKELFRCLPVQRLRRSMLAEPPQGSSRESAHKGRKDSNAIDSIFLETAMLSAARPATFGEVDAFISYAWQDCGDELYDALEAWVSATRRRRALSPTDELTVWLDRACLRGGSEITVLLACLPIFLAGCNQLLVLAGPTFSSRLWCAMELFVFIRSACMQRISKDAPQGTRNGPMPFTLPSSFAPDRCTPARAFWHVCLQWEGSWTRSAFALWLGLTHSRTRVRSRTRSRSSTPRRPIARWRVIGTGSLPSSRRRSVRWSPSTSACESCLPQSWPPLPPLMLRLRARPSRHAPRCIPRGARARRRWRRVQRHRDRDRKYKAHILDSSK